MTSTVEARPHSDDGKPSNPASPEEGKGGTESMPDSKAGAQYIYYRLYTKDGPLESNNAIYSNDRCISRISSRSVRPPHTAALLKKYVCKVEGLKACEKCILYQSLSEQTALPDSTRLSFQDTHGRGFTEMNPMALVVDASVVEKRPQVANTVNLPKWQEQNDKQRYVYYLLYDEDGEVVPKTSFSGNYPPLGRVNSLSIPPPYTVSSLKHHLIKSEGILGQNVQLFENEDSESHMDDSGAIALLADTFPGFMEDRPLSVVYESVGNASPINNEDIQARELVREARSALEESQKSNETLARELAHVRQEFENAKETHAHELHDARSALDRLKEAHARDILEAESLSQLQARLKMPSFTKKLKAKQDWDGGDVDPEWHSVKAGEILYSDGVLMRKIYHKPSDCPLWDCYLAINSSGEVAFACHVYLA